MGRRIAVVITVVPLLAVLAAGCGAGDNIESSAEAPAEQRSDAGARRQGATGSDEAFGGTGPTAPVQVTDPTDADTEVAPPPPGTGTPVSRGDRIVKQGTMTVQVDEGGFDDAHEGLVELAASLGGSVASTSSSTRDDGLTRGTVTVRVPVDRYDELLVAVRRIGEVTEREITSQDVSTEVADLASRMRHLRAQETFFLDLLDQAQGINEAMELQSRLAELTAEIERIQGRQRLLDDRTAFSTLTVDIVEAGAEELVDAGSGPDLGSYLDAGIDAFVRILGVILLIGVATAPFTVPVALALAIWGLRRRARARDAAPPHAPTGAPVEPARTPASVAGSVTSEER